EGFCVWMQLAISGLYMPTGPRANVFGPGFPSADVKFDNGDAFELAMWPPDSSALIAIIDVGPMLWFPDNSKSYLLIANVNDAALFNPVFTTQDTYDMDKKIDDGRPGTGRFGVMTPMNRNCTLNNTGTAFSSPNSEYDLSDKAK